MRAYHSFRFWPRKPSNSNLIILSSSHLIPSTPTLTPPLPDQTVCRLHRYLCRDLVCVLAPPTSRTQHQRTDDQPDLLHQLSARYWTSVTDWARNLDNSTLTVVHPRIDQRSTVLESGQNRFCKRERAEDVAARQQQQPPKSTLTLASLLPVPQRFSILHL